MRWWPAMLCIALLPALLRGQPEVAGRLLEKVICEADESQSYALYVPSNYTAGKKWPVIFCFDASARGLMPVDRLRVAAEKYGYIVTGSLTSRNGPWAANSTAAQAMVKDVSAHFLIDQRRIYTTGVSGGARVATALALSGLAKGVIACSGGFPVPDSIPRQVTFAFLGTAGAEDFNYWEMRRLDEELEARHAEHRLVIFDGGHEWASAALMMEGVEWLELQAMKTGAQPKNVEFIEAMLRTRLAAVPTQPGLDRWRALRSLAADFSGLADISAFAREVGELRDSREVKAGLKAERKGEKREAGLVEKLGEIALESTTRKQNFSSDLRRMAEALEDSPERRSARRAIATYFSMARETIRGLFEEREYGRASSMLELSAMLRPAEKQVLFDLARARALSGDGKQAVESLRRAFAAGFRDVGRIESEPAFVKLTSEADFQEFLAKVRTGPPEPIVEMPVMRVSAALASVELRIFSQPNVESAARPLSFLRVERVRPDTAASRAGIVPGMEIVAIQGVRVRGLTEEELGDTMQLPIRNEIVLAVREPPRTAEREIHLSLPKPRDVAASSAEETEINPAAVAR